ncbi:hypothetical protein AB6A40_007483 [Gnathostoma spinigerum]|uniref:Uncharacterized protein n=1 Tax=Gnathostoma spinigerum TaxID=75299 RepID=A0ABD6ELD2_9BILA
MGGVRMGAFRADFLEFPVAVVLRTSTLNTFAKISRLRTTTYFHNSDPCMEETQNYMLSKMVENRWLFCTSISYL